MKKLYASFLTAFATVSLLGQSVETSGFDPKEIRPDSTSTYTVVLKDINGNISAEPTNYEILTLYFMSADGTRLDYEIREVEVNPNQPIERFIIEQLIKGPENGELKGVIPTDTKIL